MALMLPLSMGYGILVDSISNNGLLHYNLTAIFISTVMIGVYWRIIKHIKDVARSEPE